MLYYVKNPVERGYGPDSTHGHTLHRWMEKHLFWVQNRQSQFDDERPRVPSFHQPEPRNDPTSTQGLVQGAIMIIVIGLIVGPIAACKGLKIGVFAPPLYGHSLLFWARKMLISQ